MLSLVVSWLADQSISNNWLMFYFFINFSAVKVQHYHMCGYCIVNVIVSVVRGINLIKMMPIWIRIRLAILMPIQNRVWVPDLHQNNANLNADPSPSFAHFGKLGLIFLLWFCSVGRLKYIYMSANVLWFLCNCGDITHFTNWCWFSSDLALWYGLEIYPHHLSYPHQLEL